jgi:hypothetical protein
MDKHNISVLLMPNYLAKEITKILRNGWAKRCIYLFGYMIIQIYDINKNVQYSTVYRLCPNITEFPFFNKDSILTVKWPCQHSFI